MNITLNITLNITNNITNNIIYENISNSFPLIIILAFFPLIYVGFYVLIWLYFEKIKPCYAYFLNKILNICNNCKIKKKKSLQMVNLVKNLLKKKIKKIIL